jgi:hypothetical protein
MLVQEMEHRMKKAQSSSKNNLKLKRDFKENERQMHKMRKELIELKERDKFTTAKLQEAQN